MGKILVYYVHPDKSIEKKAFRYKENKLIIGKDREILFKPEHLFLQKRFLFPPRPCLILLEGKPEPEKISSPNPEGTPHLFPKMTYGEICELIKREVARARMRIKPISLNLFIILLMAHIIEIIMIIMMMRGIRIA